MLRSGLMPCNVTNKHQAVVWHSSTSARCTNYFLLPASSHEAHDLPVLPALQQGWLDAHARLG